MRIINRKLNLILSTCAVLFCAQNAHADWGESRCRYTCTQITCKSSNMLKMCMDNCKNHQLAIKNCMESGKVAGPKEEQQVQESEEASTPQQANEVADLKAELAQLKQQNAQLIEWNGRWKDYAEGEAKKCKDADQAALAKLEKETVPMQKENAALVDCPEEITVPQFMKLIYLNGQLDGGWKTYGVNKPDDEKEKAVFEEFRTGKKKITLAQRNENFCHYGAVRAGKAVEGEGQRGDIIYFTLVRGDY